MDSGNDPAAIARIVRQEREVATLTALGACDAEIARRLPITAETVANHVEGALRRLELRARARSVAWVVEHGLYRSDQDDDPPNQPQPPTLDP